MLENYSISRLDGGLYGNIHFVCIEYNLLLASLLSPGVASFPDSGVVGWIADQKPSLGEISINFIDLDS